MRKIHLLQSLPFSPLPTQFRPFPSCFLPHILRPRSNPTSLASSQLERQHDPRTIDPRARPRRRPLIGSSCPVGSAAATVPVSSLRQQGRRRACLHALTRPIKVAGVHFFAALHRTCRSSTADRGRPRPSSRQRSGSTSSPASASPLASRTTRCEFKSISSCPRTRPPHDEGAIADLAQLLICRKKAGAI